MTLTQAGINYICQQFGLNNCCVEAGLSWFYTIGETQISETGGTAQIVSRLASGLIDSLTMTNPARGTFTQTDLNAANEGIVVTLQDAKNIALHDEPAEEQYCYGEPPIPDEPEGNRKILKLIKCMFPRLMTKTPTPRITNNGMTPRIDCIKETGIIPLQSRTGALGATRGRKIGRRLRAKYK